MSPILEFTRPIDGRRLPPAGGVYEIAATAEERAALARRFDLLQLGRLAARVELTPVPGGFFRLSATLEAELVQACVVTLEPVPSRIEETFSLLYGAVDEQKDIMLDGDSETVEPIEGGMIDIGEAVAQQLSLALDPFPRAAFADAEAAAEASEPARLDSPFAILAQLRKTPER